MPIVKALIFLKDCWRFHEMILLLPCNKSLALKCRGAAVPLLTRQEMTQKSLAQSLEEEVDLLQMTWISEKGTGIKKRRCGTLSLKILNLLLRYPS